VETIYGVALGPGDPELITLKALRILKEADLIFYPGSINKGKQRSFVLSILRYHQLDEEKLIGFFLEMSLERVQAQEIYEQTATHIKHAFEQGKKVCIVCEGDISLYSTFSYLLKKLQDVKLPISLIPGINSFSLGAANHQTPICTLNDKVAILPRESKTENLEAYLQDFDTLILMKIRTAWAAIKQIIASNPDIQFYYCERLGTKEEFISRNIAEVSDRELPYFSLVILKKRTKK